MIDMLLYRLPAVLPAWSCHSMVGIVTDGKTSVGTLSNSHSRRGAEHSLMGMGVEEATISSGCFHKSKYAMMQICIALKLQRK